MPNWSGGCFCWPGSSCRRWGTGTTARCSTVVRGRSSRSSTCICTCWQAGCSRGRRGKGGRKLSGHRCLEGKEPGGKKKTPAFWARCLPEGRKCAVRALLSEFFTYLSVATFLLPSTHSFHAMQNRKQIYDRLLLL